MDPDHPLLIAREKPVFNRIERSKDPGYNPRLLIDFP
jgi:hypothetical protein